MNKALPGVLPEPPLPPRTRVMRVALWTIYGLFAGSCFFAAAALLTHWHGMPFSKVIAVVFLLFGTGKIVLALDALKAPAAQAPQSDQRQATGSPAFFRLWVIYKMVPGVIGLGIGAWLLIAGSLMVDHMPYFK